MVNETSETPVGPPPHGHIAPPVLSKTAKFLLDEDEVLVVSPPLVVNELDEVERVPVVTILAHWVLRSFWV